MNDNILQLWGLFYKQFTGSTDMGKPPMVAPWATLFFDIPIPVPMTQQTSPGPPTTFFQVQVVTQTYLGRDMEVVMGRWQEGMVG